ncbi:MAG: hypothetical protein EKK48_28190 [Candidatus Melainabacteria bacterium]|nr:MAG: hypothetical protein EKK48_28190 [Candidatus Melainabacteria bacterium]
MQWQTSLLPALLVIAVLNSASANAQRVAAPDAGNTLAAGNTPMGDNHVAVWFSKYDAIRRAAQMTPQERQRADNLMSKGLSIVVPGPEKVITGQLLNKLINKNRIAADQMKGLPLYKETEQLHRGYYQYFTTAQALFSDYLRVQNDILARDMNGAVIAGGLMNRKQALSNLDENNKMLDAQLRQEFNIPPYRY